MTEITKERRDAIRATADRLKKQGEVGIIEAASLPDFEIVSFDQAALSLYALLDALDAAEAERDTLRADHAVMANYVRPLIPSGQNPDQATNVYAWVGMLAEARNRADAAEAKMGEPVAWLAGPLEWADAGHGLKATAFAPNTPYRIHHEKDEGWFCYGLPAPDGFDTMAQAKAAAQADWAARSAPPAAEPVIPEGWVLVPHEPTEEMLAAVWSIYTANGKSIAAVCYDAMLAAAPALVSEKEAE